MTIKRILILIGIVHLAGCMSTNSYVDPMHQDATYQIVDRWPDPMKVRLVTEFQRDGEHLPKVDPELRGHVERVARATGFVEPVTQGEVGTMRIVMNNKTEMGEAVAKGVVTGLTFGLVGSMVTDFYELSGSLSLNGVEFDTRTYKHALHSTVGNKAGSANLEPVTPSAGFGVIVEQLVLKFLANVQSKINR